MHDILIVLILRTLTRFISPIPVHTSRLTSASPSPHKMYLSILLLLLYPSMPLHLSISRMTGRVHLPLR